MKRKLTVIAALLAIIIAMVISVNYTSKHSALTDFSVNYHTIESSKLPASFNDVSIMFLADLEYGSLFGKQRLDKLSERISSIESDIIIFGGDLFDRNFITTEEAAGELTAFLKGLYAPLGKFAILGDFDIVSSERMELVKKILYDSDFELLGSEPMNLHNSSMRYITLTGISYTDNIQISENFTSLSDTVFNMAVIHGAELFDSFPKDLIDLTLCGHSHHMQINYPLFGASRQYMMTGSYKTGKYTSGNSILYISQGIGTTGIDQRLFCSPEIVVFRLKSTQVQP